jgi:hypothetical protein
VLWGAHAAGPRRRGSPFRGHGRVVGRTPLVPEGGVRGTECPRDFGTHSERTLRNRREARSLLARMHAGALER